MTSSGVEEFGQLRVAHLGDAAEGARLLAPMRALGPVLLDTVDDMPYRGIARIHEDPPDPAPTWRDPWISRRMRTRRAGLGRKIILKNSRPSATGANAARMVSATASLLWTDLRTASTAR